MYISWNDFNVHAAPAGCIFVVRSTDGGDDVVRVLYRFLLALTSSRNVQNTATSHG
jgi:hypothetical protein